MISNSSETNRLYPLTTWFPMSNYKAAGKSYALHYMLAHGQAEKNIKWIKEKLTKEDLCRQDPIYGLTPLHVAALKGDQSMFNFLLEQGIPLELTDRHQYTVLHHVTICQNEVMKNLIQTADKASKLMSMKTHLGQTAKDLEVMLSRKPADPNQPVFNYQDEKTGEMIYNASAKKFKEMTGADYSDYMITSPEALVKIWMTNLDTPKDETGVKLLAHLKTQYEKTFKLHPVSLYLSKNKEVEAGYDVCAGQEIELFQIITPYIGEYVTQKPLDGSYLLDEIDGKRVRNLGPLMNDGFPNMICIPLQNVDGFPEISVCVSMRKILKGEKLLWNYGSQHAIKSSQLHMELNLEKFEKYFKIHSPNQIFKDLFEQTNQLFRPGKAHPSIDKVLQLETGKEGLKYLFNTPSSLLHLLLKGYIDAEECMALIHQPQFVNLLQLKNSHDFNLLYCLLHGYKECQELMETNGLKTQFESFISSLLSTIPVKILYHVFVWIHSEKKINSHNWSAVQAKIGRWTKAYERTVRSYNEIQTDKNVKENLEIISTSLKEFPLKIRKQAVSEYIATASVLCPRYNSEFEALLKCCESS